MKISSSIGLVLFWQLLASFPTLGSLAPLIRLNSVGFLLDQSKQASLAMATTNFSIVRRSDGVAVLQGKATGPRRNADSEEDLYLADFSELKEAGTFELLLPGGEKSAPFNISRSLYHEPFRAAMLGMYLWRCGTAVSAAYAGQRFAHAACHTNDAGLDFAGATNMQHTAIGGWHDAGDYNKYVVNAGVSVGCMLRAWEDFGPAIRTLKIGLPGGDRRLPEFLQELKWELDWLFTMQADDGSVWHKVSTLKFGGFVMPEAESARRYFAPWSSAATADLVAMLAQAARSYQDYDIAYAERCRGAAEKSYAFLQAHPENHSADQSPFATGAYPTTDEDDRLWAAAELWETTGDPNVLRDFEKRANDFNQKVDTTFDWGNVKNLGMLTYVSSRRAGRTAALVQAIQHDLLAAADKIVSLRDAHGYARPLGTVYHWGANGAVARQTVLLQAAHRLSPQRAYREAALDALGYLLGRNCYGRSFVTGVGFNPPMHPHDRRSGADNLEDPWPGYLVGGPQRRATDWQDAQADYRTNEIAINWNAALIYALAGFLDAESP